MRLERDRLTVLVITILVIRVLAIAVLVVAWEQCRAKHCAACQKKQRALLGASSAWLEHVSNKVVCCWDANVCRLLLQAGCRCEVLKFSCCCWLEIHAACWCKKTGQQGLGVVLTILVIAILVIAILVIAYKHTAVHSV
jgi:hypothetical protein